MNHRSVIILLATLSFLCIVRADRHVAIATNEALGCETFAEWENATGERLYIIQHCPAEMWSKVITDGRWTE